jgi:hypothetical protein
MNNFSPGLKRLHDKIVNPGLKFQPCMLAGLKTFSCNCAFDFDGVLYYRQGWNLNTVNMAESNPGVENASFNRPLKTLIPEKIILCPAYIYIVYLYWTEAAQIPDLGLKNTCCSCFPTDPIFFCQHYYFFYAAKRAALFSLGCCRLHICIQCSMPKWHLLSQ